MSGSQELNRIAMTAPEVMALKKPAVSDDMVTGGQMGYWFTIVPGEDGVEPMLRFTLPLEADVGGPSFAATIRVCINPACRCGYIGFDCRPMTGDEVPSPDEPGYETPLRLDLDVFDRRVKPPPIRSEASNALAQAVEEEMRDGDWEWLKNFLQAAKRRQMEKMDLATVDAMFPVEVVKDGAMVGYREVFPWAEVWAFESGVDRWLVWDEYCAQPGCDCTEVALAFVRLDDEVAAAEGRFPEPDCWLIFDPKTNRWRVDNAEDGCPTDQLFAALRKTYPSLAQDLAERHRELQQLGRRLIGKRSRSSGRSLLNFWRNDPENERQQASVLPSAPVLGRNDSCHCGSGKKYKKCCMGVQ
jgi:hypothetical protein